MKSKKDAGHCIVSPGSGCPSCPPSQPIEGAVAVSHETLCKQFIDASISNGWVITRRTGGRTSFFLTEAGREALGKLGITF